MNIQAPVPVEPAHGAVLTTLEPTLRTTNAAKTGPAGSLSYEFQVSQSESFASLVASHTVAEQSGATAVGVGPLASAQTFFWRVRAREATVDGHWSTTHRFVTPAPVVTPPSSPLPPSNPGPRPGVREGEAMVAAVIADMRARGISARGDCGAWEITRRVAWAFRNRGAGLELKPGGRNCHSNSIDIVLFTDGQSVDILVGAGDDNGPTWQEHGVLSDWRNWWVEPTNPD